MPNIKPFPDPASARPLTDEADIGSGEKTAAQLETETMIGQIPPLPESDNSSDDDAGDDDAGDDDADGGDAAGAGRERREHDASLLRDEPADDVNGLDPAPPKGR